ncbi:hypothetical protein VIN30_03580 [Adlercreutzia sp. R7]|uniref:Ferric oxidoreductase domain-containing protein n=1 Tax=Adlercreutzia wanghongyangiae TaxID=3111451 RepID=A0ABU6IGH0_9ACTN|nr:hypothetical protein [Adlercreutzia sp. R7]
MTFLLVLLATCLVVWATARLVGKCPAVLYVVSLGVAAASWLALLGDMPAGVGRALIMLVRHCYLPLSIFYAVMLIGALGEDSALRRRLQPVRGAWSIAGCLMVVGHLALYLAMYLPRLTSIASLRVNVVAMVALGLVLTVFTVVLGITSVKAVKKRMTAARWKSVQRLSYGFWGATYVHLLMVLLPSAAAGSVAAEVNLSCYTAVFALYLVLRVRRAIIDRTPAPSAVFDTTGEEFDSVAA